MPETDMSEDAYVEECARRGIIGVSSSFSGIVFKVRLETESDMQESLGYGL